MFIGWAVHLHLPAGAGISGCQRASERIWPAILFATDLQVTNGAAGRGLVSITLVTCSFARHMSDSWGFAAREATHCGASCFPIFLRIVDAPGSPAESSEQLPADL